MGILLVEEWRADKKHFVNLYPCHKSKQPARVADMAHSSHSHIFPEPDSASHDCAPSFLTDMQSSLISPRRSQACKNQKLVNDFERNLVCKLVSSRNSISSHSIWFINLTKKKGSLQYAKSAAWHRADTGYTPRLPRSNPFSLPCLYFVSEIKNSKWPSAE